MDINDLTMRELRELQKKLKLPADKLEEDAFGFMAGMAWLIKRRDDETYTFDQALDLTQIQIAEIIGTNEVDPNLEN